MHRPNFNQSTVRVANNCGTVQGGGREAQEITAERQARKRPATDYIEDHESIQPPSMYMPGMYKSRVGSVVTRNIIAPTFNQSTSLKFKKSRTVHVHRRGAPDVMSVRQARKRPATDDIEDDESAQPPFSYLPGRYNCRIVTMVTGNMITPNLNQF